MAFPVLVSILVFAHGLALTEAIGPAFGVLLVLEVAWDIFAKLTGDCPGGLPATAATVIEAIGERWRITLGDQVLVGRLTPCDQDQ
jgi:hypothetical protein